MKNRRGTVDPWPESMEARMDNPMIGREMFRWMGIMEDRISIQTKKIPRRENDKGFKR
jgi:hypothetical protein